MVSHIKLCKLYLAYEEFNLLYQVHSRTRMLGADELLEQLPALQQLLYRLVGCQVIAETE